MASYISNMTTSAIETSINAVAGRIFLNGIDSIDGGTWNVVRMYLEELERDADTCNGGRCSEERLGRMHARKVRDNARLVLGYKPADFGR